MALAGPEPRQALEAWGIGAASLTPMPGGHINGSWRVDLPSGDGFLLQRLNPEVFPDGAAVMRNVRLVTEHLGASLRDRPDARRLALSLVPRPDGSIAWRAPDGAWWRIFRFIDGARSCLRVTTAEDASAVGTAFGQFQQQLRDYAGPELSETIPGFHDTAARLDRLERAIAEDRAGHAAAVQEEIGFGRARRAYAEVVPALVAGGALPRRIVHNDAKASNVLLDAATGAPLAVVDLDTVMPGTLLADVGDLIRSIASDTDEDERDLDRIRVRADLLAAMARGFLGACGGGLSAAERSHFVFAGLLLSYEQGVRFLTDHLDGDRYFRTSRPDQNLDRARAQFRLLAELERARPGLEAMVVRILEEPHP